MARVVKKKPLVITVPDEAVVPEAVSRKKILSWSPTVAVMTFLLCLALGTAGYFYYQYQNTAEVLRAQELADLTETIGAMLELPTDETPTLATVTDRDKLAEQPFFRKAENGDKVLIYQESGRAILFRPGVKWYQRGKIIDVTAVNVGESVAPSSEPDVLVTAPVEPDPVPAITTPASPTIALYNGSARVGVTNTLETDIVTQFPEAVVTVKEKAVKTDYQGNLVIDLSGNNADLAAQLATSIGGTVTTLPAGEVTPTTDILIIVGNK